MKKLISTLVAFNHEDHSGKPPHRLIMKYYFMFMIGSVIGWIYEEIYYMLDGHFVDRGFMYGPWLPVYGVGTILLLVLLRKVKKYPPLIFLGALLITGVLEYFAGYATWHFMHEHLWNYTGLFLNINGYVCLRSVINFGFLALLFFYIVEPIVDHNLPKMKDRTLLKTDLIILAVFLFDLIMSFIFKR